MNPQLAEAYVNRGLAYGKLGNHQQEIKDFKIAARLGHEKSQDFLKSKGIVW
jgi:tetratricopeptide (TPR) repeat protein